MNKSLRTQFDLVRMTAQRTPACVVLEETSFASPEIAIDRSADQFLELSTIHVYNRRGSTLAPSVLLSF